jgi:dihydrofolate reductase
VREVTADLFISLDGFALGVDVGPFFGYSGPELDRWIHRHLDEPQELIMGRVTYEAMSAISSSSADEGSARMNELPKLVFSNTLQEPLQWKNARLIRGDLATEITSLKDQPGEPLRSIGSVTLVKSMVELGLVDRLRLAIFPLVLGHAGRELIFAAYPRIRLELTQTAVIDWRIVMAEYRPTGKWRERN